MIELPESTLADIRKHASEEYPRECCGVVIVFKGRYRYIACRNVAEDNNNFIIYSEDLVSAEEQGEVLLIVHSHCNIPPVPSQADLVGCEVSQVPWLIVNWPTGAINIIEPKGYKAPLIGREFSHGVLDCYSLVKDYYKEILNIELNSYWRDNQWWHKGQNLYLDNADSGGFVQVNTPETHDVVLMSVSSEVPNHAAIWLGDGTIMHHQTNRLSSRDVYGGWYRKITTHFFRHRSFIK
jgi:proteasome lid subunit RPN8/RPN11